MSTIPPNKVFYNDDAERQLRVKQPAPGNPFNRSNAGTNWSPEEREKLKLCFASGMSLAEIANEHGRTAGAILGKLMEHRLLVQDRNGFYYKVSPDAWCSYHDARHADAGAPA
jgi:hypothetical protein